MTKSKEVAAKFFGKLCDGDFMGGFESLSEEPVMSSIRIAVIAGDGIGKEVIPAGIAALEAAVRGSRVSLSFENLPWS